MEGSPGYDQALRRARNAIRPYVEQEYIEEEDDDAAIVREVREGRQRRDEAQQQRNLDANRHSANPFSPDVRRRSIPPPHQSAHQRPPPNPFQHPIQHQPLRRQRSPGNEAEHQARQEGHHQPQQPHPHYNARAHQQPQQPQPPQQPPPHQYQNQHQPQPQRWSLQSILSLVFVAAGVLATSLYFLQWTRAEPSTSKDDSQAGDWAEPRPFEGRHITESDIEGERILQLDLTYAKNKASNISSGVEGLRDFTIGLDPSTCTELHDKVFAIQQDIQGADQAFVEVVVAWTRYVGNMSTIQERTGALTNQSHNLISKFQAGVACMNNLTQALECGYEQGEKQIVQANRDQALRVFRPFKEKGRFQRYRNQLRNETTTYKTRGDDCSRLAKHLEEKGHVLTEFRSISTRLQDAAAGTITDFKRELKQQVNNLTGKKSTVARFMSQQDDQRGQAGDFGSDKGSGGKAAADPFS